MEKEIVYIEFLNKDKNFQLDVMEFNGKDAIKNARDWGIQNLDNFSMDMIRIRKI